MNMLSNLYENPTGVMISWLLNMGFARKLWILNIPLHPEQSELLSLRTIALFSEIAVHNKMALLFYRQYWQGGSLPQADRQLILFLSHILRSLGFSNDSKYMLLKSWFYTSLTVDNRATSIFQIFNVFSSGLEFPCIENVCREPETLSMKCYTNSSICELSIFSFSFNTGTFKARTTEESSRQKIIPGGLTFLSLDLMLTQLFGPVTEPLCASVSSSAKWGLNVLIFFFIRFCLQFWNKRCLR